MGRVIDGYVSPIKAAPPSPNWRSTVTCTMLTEIPEIMARLEQCPPDAPIAIDTETTGLDHGILDLVGYSFCFTPNEAFYVPIGHKVGVNAPKAAVMVLNQFIEKHKAKVLFYNYLFDGRVLRKFGLDLDKVHHFDVMPLVWNVDTNVHMPSLKMSAKYYLGINTEHFDDILGGAKDFSQLAPQQVAEYAALDAYLTLRLAMALVPFYNKNKFIVDLDIATARAMIDYEDTKVSVDMRALRDKEQDIRREIATLEGEIYQIAGNFFKINSPEVLSSVLQTLGVNTGKFTAKKGYMSTSIDDLEAVPNQHQIIPKIVQYKKLIKKLSTYIEPLANAATSHDGGVRFQYQLCNVPTGRMSSGVGKDKKQQDYFCEINIQSFPKPNAMMYRAEKSVEPGNVLGYKFVPDPNGQYEGADPVGNVREFLVGKDSHYVVSVDFVMEEIMIAANMSHDPAFVEPLKRGEDIHTATAKFMFESVHIDKQQRKIAKTCNFGLLYGGNDYTLHNNMPDKTQEECREYYSKWRELHHHLWRAYMPKLTNEARAKGFCTNAFGRIRRVAYWYALGTYKDAGFADRTVWNNQVQGTAADIMRVALVRMHKHLYKNPAHQDHFKFMASLHDELVFSIAKDPVVFNKIMDVMTEDMTKLPFNWTIPMRVEVSVGNSWGQVFKFKRTAEGWEPVAG